MYFSKRCAYSKALLEALYAVPELTETTRTVCVEEEPFPRSITQVPAVEEGPTLYQGQDAFEWIRMKKRALPEPFAYDCGGPSPSTVFSYVDENTGYGHRQDAFGSFDIDNTGEGSQHIPSGGPLDDLISKRKAEVPQSIARQ